MQICIIFCFDIQLNIFCLFFLSSLLKRSYSSPNDRIFKMMTNGISEPIGYDFSSLSLSWIIECSNASKVIDSKVVIALDSNFSNPVHNSGYQNTISSLDYNPHIILKPRTRYYWRVIVRVDQGQRKIRSNSTFFETGKMSEEWKGKWITSSFSQIFPPYLRKYFYLDFDPQTNSKHESRIYICGLGLYELYINGKKISDEHFTPYCTGYKYWLQYQSYDVSSYLQKGKNVIGVMLGDGWAKGRFWFSTESADLTMETEYLGNPINLATDKYELICELHIKSDDQKEIVILTDDSWKCEKSPIVRDNIYDGEVYNSNLQINDWCNPNYNDEKWKPVTVISDEKRFNLTERLSPPVVVKKKLKPKAVLKGNVVDVGQNIAGWIELTIDSPKDFETIIEFGEMYVNGVFMNENLRSARQQFRFISNGEKMTIRPHFTFYGFQYIKFTQFHYDKEKTDLNLIDYFNITCCSIYSDLEEIGYFECGLENVNKLFSNAFWSQRDNFLDVPTDCPQRDERMGWTGDAQAFCSSAMFNMRAYPFYRKYLRDLYLLQKGSYSTLKGAVSSIVPFFGIENEEQMAGRVGWADAATVIPFKLYEHTGKKQILIDQFESMKMWVDYVGNQVFSSKKPEHASKSFEKDDKNYGGIWKAESFHFGDWLALDGKKGTNFGGTELTFICSCFYFYSLRIFVDTINILKEGNSNGKLFELEKKYRKRMDQTLLEIRDEYMTPSGRIAIQTQSAQALSLYLNISVNQNNVLHCLKNQLRKSNYKLKTGFVGTPILCRSLSDAGDPCAAYSLFLNDDFPGWLFEVKMNSTSIWERWDSIGINGEPKKDVGINSLNHYVSGSVIEWLYRNVAGINPVIWAPGFKEFALKPQPDIRMGKAKAFVNSPMGKIESAWKIFGIKKDVKLIENFTITDSDNLTISYKFIVPFNSIAHLKLLNVSPNEVKLRKLNTSKKFNKITDDDFDDANYDVEDNKIIFTKDGKDATAILNPGNYLIKTPYRQLEIPIDDSFI